MADSVSAAPIAPLNVRLVSFDQSTVILEDRKGTRMSLPKADLTADKFEGLRKAGSTFAPLALTAREGAHLRITTDVRKGSR